MNKMNRFFMILVIGAFTCTTAFSQDAGKGSIKSNDQGTTKTVAAGKVSDNNKSSFCGNFGSKGCNGHGACLVDKNKECKPMCCGEGKTMCCGHDKRVCTKPCEPDSCKYGGKGCCGKR